MTGALRLQRSNDAGTECRRGKSESNGVRTLPDTGNWLQVALETNPDVESWNLTALGAKESTKNNNQTNLKQYDDIQTN